MTKQQIKVLRALSTGEMIPHYVFSSRLYIHNYSARIHELRAMGYTIEKKRHKSKLSGGIITNYWIPKKEDRIRARREIQECTNTSS